MEAGPQLAVPCPAPSTLACPPGVGRPPQRGTQGGNSPRVGSADGASDRPAAPPSGPLSSVGEWRVPLGAGMVVRAPLPRSPPVLSTPRLRKGGASTRSQRQSATGSRPLRCLGPSSAAGCAPRAPGGRGPSPLPMLPGHSHLSSSWDAAPSTQLWARMDPSPRPGPPSMPQGPRPMQLRALGGTPVRPRRRCCPGRGSAPGRPATPGACPVPEPRTETGAPSWAPAHRWATGSPRAPQEGTWEWEGPGDESGGLL